MELPGTAPYKSWDGFEEEESELMKRFVLTLLSANKTLSGARHPSKKATKALNKEIKETTEDWTKAILEWVERPRPSTPEALVNDEDRKKLRKLYWYIQDGLANPVIAQSGEFISRLEALSIQFAQEGCGEHEDAEYSSEEEEPTEEELARRREEKAADFMANFWNSDDQPISEDEDDEEDVLQAEEREEFIVEDKNALVFSDFVEPKVDGDLIQKLALIEAELVGDMASDASSQDDDEEYVENLTEGDSDGEGDEDYEHTAIEDKSDDEDEDEAESTVEDNSDEEEEAKFTDEEQSEDEDSTEKGNTKRDKIRGGNTMQQGEFYENEVKMEEDGDNIQERREDENSSEKDDAKRDKIRGGDTKEQGEFYETEVKMEEDSEDSEKERHTWLREGKIPFRR